MGELLNQCNINDKGIINVFLLRNIGTAKDLADLDNKELLSVVSPEILSKLQRKVESLVQPHENSYNFLRQKVVSRAVRQDKAENTRKRSRSRGEEILSAINNLGEKPVEKANGRESSNDSDKVNVAEPLITRKKKKILECSQNLEPHQDNSCHHLEVALDSLQENATPDEPSHISAKGDLEGQGNGQEQNEALKVDLESMEPTIQREASVVEINITEDCDDIKFDQQGESIPPTPQFEDTGDRKVLTNSTFPAIADPVSDVKVEDTEKNEIDAPSNLESSNLPGSLSLEQVLTEERLMKYNINELVDAIHRITSALQRKLHSTQ